MRPKPLLLISGTGPDGQSLMREVLAELPTVEFRIRVQACVEPSAGFRDGAPAEVPRVTCWIEVLDLAGNIINVTDQQLPAESGIYGPLLSYMTTAEGVEFLEAVRARFAQEAPLFLLLETLNFFSDLIEYQQGVRKSGKRNRVDDEDTVAFHLQRTKEFLERQFHLYPEEQPQRKRRRRNLWTKDELSVTVRAVARGLPPAERTYARVAEVIKTLHRERAPASGEALRKLCERLGVKTKLIKHGGKRTVKKKPA